MRRAGLARDAAAIRISSGSVSSVLVDQVLHELITVHRSTQGERGP